MKKPSILLTNDDGIESAGLWAAAEALLEIGELTIAAPGEQWSGAGRSVPQKYSGRIVQFWKKVGGADLPVYAVNGSPAQAVMVALLEILRRPPALVVAGINCGENVGSGITISGTIGAVLEAASTGLPALAVSQEVPLKMHLGQSGETDFQASAYFTHFFARKMLAGSFGPDVDALKVDVPANATVRTSWKVTRLSRTRYFIPERPRRDISDQIPFRISLDRKKLERDSDIYALRVERKVAVTPLSLDLTSRTNLAALEKELRTV